jgi:hypothetical protein
MGGVAAGEAGAGAAAVEEGDAIWRGAREARNGLGC